MKDQRRSLSRRSFIGGAGILAASAFAASTAGCAPSTTTKAENEPASTPASADGSPSWLGQAPEVEESAITDTLTTDLVIVGAGNGGMAAAAYAAREGVDFMVFDSAGAVSTTRGWFAAVDSPLYASQGVQ